MAKIAVAIKRKSLTQYRFFLEKLRFENKLNFPFQLCSLAMLIFGSLILTENDQKVRLILHWYKPPIKKLGLTLVVFGTFNLLVFCPLSFYGTLQNHRLLLKLVKIHFLPKALNCSKILQGNAFLFIIIISEMVLWFLTTTQIKTIQSTAKAKWDISMKIFDTNCSLVNHMFLL